MRNFHVTRIAVTALLIVALAIQPVAVCLASVECYRGCSDSAALPSQDCRCFEVAHSDDRCCCSAPSENVEAEATESSCCSSKHMESEPAGSPSDADDATSTAPVTSGLRSTCLCEQASQPISDSSPRRPSSQHRDTLSLTTKC